jgi:hypothetical protein
MEMMETSMSGPDRAQVRRSRIQLLLIFALFLLPPISAWIAWQYLGEQGVDSTTNAGGLITPARPLQVAGLMLADGAPLDQAVLRGRWTYVLFAPTDCDARCEEQLYLTRQTRLAMNKDIPRVQRLLVFAGVPSDGLQQRLAAEHADLTWAVRDAAAESMLARFRGPGFAPDRGQFFLVDPLGNLMMFYDREVPAKGMMKDLQKLLKISQIG